jgi:putative ABC transport system permease protein
MFGYYLRLALKSFRRNPGITALMVIAIALGIAVCVMTLTVYHAMAGNPIWWKNERLYAVTMDNWDPYHPLSPKTDLPPPQMTYKDTQFLFNSSIPLRKVVMYSTLGVISDARTQPQPQISTRLTTADFFAMFEVPFLYGHGWSASADKPPQPVIVLSRAQNDKLFGGVNSVGRVLRWNDHHRSRAHPLPRDHRSARREAEPRQPQGRRRAGHGLAAIAAHRSNAAVVTRVF